MIYTRAQLEAMTDDQLKDVYNSIDRSKPVVLQDTPEPQPDDFDRNVAVTRVVLILQSQEELLTLLNTKSSSNLYDSVEIEALQKEVESIQLDLEETIDILNADCDILDKENSTNETGEFSLALHNRNKIKKSAEDIEKAISTTTDKLNKLREKTVDPQDSALNEQTTSTAEESLTQVEIPLVIDENTKRRISLAQRVVEPPPSPILQIPNPPPPQQPPQLPQQEKLPQQSDKQDDTDNKSSKNNTDNKGSESKEDKENKEPGKGDSTDQDVDDPRGQGSDGDEEQDNSSGSNDKDGNDEKDDQDKDDRSGGADDKDEKIDSSERNDPSKGNDPSEQNDPSEKDKDDGSGGSGNKDSEHSDDEDTTTEGDIDKSDDSDDSKNIDEGDSEEDDGDDSALIKNLQRDLLSAADTTFADRVIKSSSSIGEGGDTLSRRISKNYLEEIFDLAGSFLSSGGRTRTYHRPSRRELELTDQPGLVPILPGLKRKSKKAQIAFYVDVSGSMYFYGDAPTKIISELKDHARQILDTRSIVMTFDTEIKQIVDLSVDPLPAITHGGSTRIDSVLRAISLGEDKEVKTVDPDTGLEGKEIINTRADVSVIITDLDNGDINLSLLPQDRLLIIVSNKEDIIDALMKDPMTNSNNVQIIYTEEW